MCINVIVIHNQNETLTINKTDETKMKKSIIAIVVTISISIIAIEYVDTMKNIFKTNHAKIEKIK